MKLLLLITIISSTLGAINCAVANSITYYFHEEGDDLLVDVEIFLGLAYEPLMGLGVYPFETFSITTGTNWGLALSDAPGTFQACGSGMLTKEHSRSTRFPFGNRRPVTNEVTGVSGAGGEMIGFQYVGSPHATFWIPSNYGFGAPRQYTWRVPETGLRDMNFRPGDVAFYHYCALSGFTRIEGTEISIVLVGLAGAPYYAGWAQQNGLSPDPMEAGNDGNGNGVVDLLEYALRLPEDAPLGGMPVAVPGPDPSAATALQFVLPAAPRLDLTLSVLASTSLDPDGWQVVASKTGSGAWSAPALVEENVQPDGSVVINVCSPWSQAEAPRVFLSLEATLE